MREFQNITWCNGVLQWDLERYDEVEMHSLKWAIEWDPSGEMAFSSMRMRFCQGAPSWIGAPTSREGKEWAAGRAIAVWGASGYDVAGAEEALQRMLAPRA